MKIRFNRALLIRMLPYALSGLFFVFYTILGLIRQNHFLSGYDLAVIDQAIWKYAHFMSPISTNHAYAFTPIYWDHIELIFLLIAPLYWLWDNVRLLIILQAFAICSTGLSVFWLARKYKLSLFITTALTISYLSFYGIQNAIWADVHSLVFGMTFLAWFVYALETNKQKLSWILFFLTIFSKEDMALLTGILSLLYFWRTRKQGMLWFTGISFVYLFFIFFIYFPHFVPGGYRFEDRSGLLAHSNPTNLFNTQGKRSVLWYSSLWYGFLPFLSPLFLLPALLDLFKYFVVGNSIVSSGQTLFGHYRSSLAFLLILPTIYSIARHKKLQTFYTGLWVLLFAICIQYALHLPLSYLTKRWFWSEPKSVAAIETVMHSIPQNAAIATQINILPHLSHRNLEFVLWPNTRDFKTNSPCGKKNCLWIRWSGSPQYVLVDVSTDWDPRYWLTDRQTFIQSLANLEKAGVLKKKEQVGTTILYQVIRQNK